LIGLKKNHSEFISKKSALRQVIAASLLQNCSRVQRLWAHMEIGSKHMFKHSHRQNGIALLATLVLFPFIAACGDEGNDKSRNASSNSGSSSGGLLVCFAYLLVSGNDDCLTSGSSSSSSSSSSSGSTGDTSGLNSSVRYVLNPEYEPNNDTMNANALMIATSPSPDGFSADGAVSDVSDQWDTYSFARRNSRYFRFVLCSDGQRLCNEYGEIDTLTAYIDVLDSNGNVLASTQAGSRNFLETPINAGLTYYVRVVAGDTMGATVSYHLTAHEFER
jgi:hypothetical protein